MGSKTNSPPMDGRGRGGVSIQEERQMIWG